MGVEQGFKMEEGQKHRRRTLNVGIQAASLRRQKVFWRSEPKSWKTIC